MSNEPNTGAPYLDETQAQKAATANSAFNVFGVLSQLCIENRTTTAPPGAPALGQAWIVAAAGSGAWAGKDGLVAAWYGAWVFLTPKEGWFAYDRGADEFVRSTGAAWNVELGTQTGWVLPTASFSRATFDPATVTLAVLAQHVAALITDLMARKLPHT